MATRMIGLMGVVLILALVGFAALVNNAAAAEAVAAAPVRWSIGNYVDTAAYLVSGAATLAAVLPIPDKAKGMIAIARQLLDVLAFNIGNAKNKK
jgi:hypothetical protein